MTQLQFLVPADPLEARRPDPYFVAQVDALRHAGHRVGVVPDAVIDGQAPLSGVPSGAVVLYRGWMLNPAGYGNFGHAIRVAGAVPYISRAQYLATHHLPGWYPLIKDLTPETHVFSRDVDLEAELRALAWPEFFVKDYVKSLKTGLGSFLNDPAHIQALLEQMESFRGEIEGGICVRRVDPVVPDSERRDLVVAGVPNAAEANEPIPEVGHPCVKRLGSPFYSVDVALREDGVERVVEVGDGQVSDLVGAWTPRRLVEILESMAQWIYGSS
jgi:hypothetical protein